MEEEMKRCRFWLPKKKRFCANIPLNTSTTFCGNHTTRTDAKWIPCPIDPSHSVLEDNLEGHKTKCPFLIQARNLSSQPYYHKGINQGTATDADHNLIITSLMKRNYVYSLTAHQLSALLSKIHNLHAAISKDIGSSSFKLPQACQSWINTEVHGKLPYQEKHVLQQASILGNLEDFGVLKLKQPQPAQTLPNQLLDHHQNPISAVVEFGAGRGYLTQVLADCYGIQKVFLVERKSYKLKADRSLRQIDNLALERLRIDIEDLNLNAVESLRGLPYLAIGKHLCGPATDLSLRCCLGDHNSQVNGTGESVSQQLRGIAVATCCHHLCQWKHYTNQQYFSNLGITDEDFQAITWFTSWAVDADHGSDLSDESYLQSQVLLSCNNENGEDVPGVEEMLKNMKPVDRAALGFMCKDIIDMGRLMWIKERGLEAKLVKYVPANISPENRLLIAK